MHHARANAAFSPSSRPTRALGNTCEISYSGAKCWFSPLIFLPHERGLCELDTPAPGTKNPGYKGNTQGAVEKKYLSHYMPE